MDADILASQKRQEMLAAFWPRKISRHITRVLVRTPITPNQITVLWGVISVLNCYTVYLALTRRWWAIPLIPVVFQLAFVFDCVDGEIARFKKMTNPIGGKLLDGMCHRATEFALLATFALAAYVESGSVFAFVAGLLLLTGDAMYVFVYERRLNALRVQAGFKGQIRRTASDVYQHGMRWSDLTRRQQLLTITGLIHYKSVYAVVPLSYLASTLFVAGLGALAVYKHWKWIWLVRQTLKKVGGLPMVAPASDKATPGETAAAGPLVH